MPRPFRLFKGVDAQATVRAHAKLCQYCLREPAVGVVMTRDGLLRICDSCLKALAHMQGLPIEEKLPTL